jgi:hypothetical protein
MPNNTDVDTSDMMPIERPPLQSGGPPLDMQPQKSPFYRGNFPTTAIVNPDSIRNFNTPWIPQYRIVPAQPLNMAGASNNAVATVATAVITFPQPPAPAISQALVTIPTGYQFTFLQVKLPNSSNPSAVISSYKVYRNTANSLGSAVVTQTISHGLSNTGSPVVVQDSQPNGVTMFYWVSAVNVSGIESTLTAAQSVTVASNAGFNSNSQIASTFHNNPVNVSWAPTNLVTLSNNSLSPIIVITANTNQFAPGQISYNSGSVNPGSFGTWVVFADDPTFAGGPSIYSFSSSINNLASAEGRLLLGKITTSPTTSSTGGGFSGGTGGVSFAGGRGLIQI